MINIKFENPIDWRKLEKKKKLNMIARLFFYRCSYLPMFKQGGGLTTDFIKVRSFFYKIINDNKEQLHILYDYLYSLEEKTPQTMTDFFNNAEDYRLKVKLEKDKELTSKLDVKQYDTYESILGDWLKS